MTTASTAPSPRSGAEGAWAFAALACAVTWLLGLPLALAFMRRGTPAPYAMALGGLSALGPTLAALAIAGPRHELRAVFGRWRTNPLWIVVALFTPAALHLAATLLEVALGGRPAQWFYPPVKPEHFAAMVMFSVGEEFGWRGFAYPRLVRRHGPVAGPLLLGVIWGVWHLVMMISPETGAFSWHRLLVTMIDLPLYCLVLAWLFERGNRSMAVAIACHAGAHLDNVYRGPESEVRLQVLRVLVLAVVAALAARALAARALAARRDHPAAD